MALSFCDQQSPALNMVALDSGRPPRNQLSIGSGGYVMSDNLYNVFGAERIERRQIDELIGIARGLTADGTINHQEVEFLQSWLTSSLDASDNAIIIELYRRINEILADGVIDEDEKAELFDTLSAISGGPTELGELLRATDLPISRPEPTLFFEGLRYSFTGTFNFGSRRACEKAVTDRGGFAGSLTQKTNILVVGTYATSSWKHSSFGDKIIRASGWRENGLPIEIVSETHWRTYLDL